MRRRFPGLYATRGFLLHQGLGATSFFSFQHMLLMRRTYGILSFGALGVRRRYGKFSGFMGSTTHGVRWQSSSEARDYYNILGVASDASADEIKVAYRRLALQYHPDRNKDPGAEEMFKKVSEAYQVVGNKTRRKEYDMTRAARSSPVGGGGGRSWNDAWDSSGEFRQGPNVTYQNISKEEADRLFRELFGGMRVDQIFRDFEEEIRRNSGSGGGGGGRSQISSEFGKGEQTFRPFFRTEATRIFTDAQGNRMEEREFRDSRGTAYKVRTVSSEQVNASSNQKPEDFYSASASSNPDNRFRFGNSSFFVNPRGATDDFGQAYFGVRTHGRHPFVAMMIAAAWGIIIGTMALGVFAFFFSHPLFTLAVFFLILLRRLRFF